MKKKQCLVNSCLFPNMTNVTEESNDQSLEKKDNSVPYWKKNPTSLVVAESQLRERIFDQSLSWKHLEMSYCQISLKMPWSCPAYCELPFNYNPQLLLCRVESAITAPPVMLLPQSPKWNIYETVEQQQQQQQADACVRCVRLLPCCLCLLW